MVYNATDHVSPWLPARLQRPRENTPGCMAAAATSRPCEACSLPAATAFRIAVVAKGRREGPGRKFLPQ